jgi:hypothetical protein
VFPLRMVTQLYSSQTILHRNTVGQLRTTSQYTLSFSAHITSGTPQTAKRIASEHK